MALTVIVNGLRRYLAAPVPGAELMEYERQCHFPPKCTPIPTYWPAW
jgi:hypothetical protein